MAGLNTVIEENRRVGGSARAIGRIGALAVFLGVGTALCLPGIAHADNDGSSSAPTSPATSSKTADGDGSATSGASTTSPPARSPKSATGKSRHGALDRREALDLKDLKADLQAPASKIEHPVFGRPDRKSKGASDNGYKPLTGKSYDAPDTSVGVDVVATPSSVALPTPVKISRPATPVARVRASSLSPLKGITAVAAQDVAPPTAEAVRTPRAPSTAVNEVISAVLAPLAGASADPGIPARAPSPAEWALLAFARRQLGDTSAVQSADAAVSAPLTAASSQLVNQVSPLVTPEVLRAERIAMQTANSLPVKLMKLFLQQQFRAAAQQQFASVGGIDAANLALLHTAVDQFALFSSFTQQLLNPMDPAIAWAIVPAHSWFGMDVGDSRYLYDNPDTIYRFVGVNNNASYVITGRFNNYDPNDPSTLPADTTFSVVEGTAGTTSSILTGRQLQIAPDGTFVITVSGDPAAPGETNHIQLTSNSTVLLARNTLGDWNTEEPMSLAITKVAGPPNSLFAQLGGFTFLGSLINDRPILVSLLSHVGPSPAAETFFARGLLTAMIMLVRGGNEEAKYIGLATHDPVTGETKPPNFIPQPSSNAEFLANQRQSIGNFQLANDQALVLTIDPGSAGYFTVPVYNVWTTTADFWDQQTSLNNEQMRVNPDGKTYTVVISPSDPGVYNWVSTGGLNQGIIAARFQDVDVTNPDTPQIVSQHVVPISEVADFFSNPTYFVTPAQRAEQLALRKAGYNKRFAPYPQV